MRRHHCWWAWAAAILACGWSLGLLAGCGPSGPGLESKPPPKGGPQASPRRPPGEVDNPHTR